jgi:hypothetical protein
MSALVCQDVRVARARRTALTLAAAFRVSVALQDLAPPPEIGREHVRALADSLERLRRGEAEAKAAISEQAHAYRELLRAHIAKERPSSEGDIALARPRRATCVQRRQAGSSTRTRRKDRVAGPLVENDELVYFMTPTRVRTERRRRS